MTGAPAWGIALIPVMVGVVYVMHGYLGLVVLGPRAMAAYVEGTGFPPALAPALAGYGIAAHLVGGTLLVLGLFSRWAALAQLPVMAAAVLLLHLRQGTLRPGRR